ncbi:ETC complex I subunit [Sphingopyxis sp. SE2]|uniref:NADH dehydrogenase ubiquinone Fe-S protein 4 n=1 Tax=Sphingopyxis sp. SE2 TaxID=1586240 RepID=UPI0028C2DDBB|nr:NADH dehydrogenase ubiquinone Fe-S protein 4 [Sphingopyxis sp. SE2]MDT7530324.1 ETC complex I subunit [Sphingopyxis sp. SE2]
MRRATFGALPDDAVAIVEPVPPSPATSGRAHRNRWRVRFAPRWGSSADPLTGWTGGGDPLGTIELRFANREFAEAYCRRIGIAFERRYAPPELPRVPMLPPVEAPPLCCWPTGPHALCCGRYPLLEQWVAENDGDARRVSWRAAVPLTGSG